MNESRFPDGFLWGAATSAYQIEGAPLADGAGPSIWHRFSHIPGNIARDETGDTACDHYNRYRGDVALMAELGLQTYRFSISWSRVLPAGRGAVNRAGLDFYSRLVDELLGHGIQPNVTLYHWDLPAALDDAGGWTHRDAAGWFADYAEIVARRIGDRVGLWTTLNEPWVIVDAGYLHGVHAPGRSSASEAVHAAHNLLRAHGAGVQALRTHVDGRIGIAINLEPKVPASDRPADAEATRRADAYMNRFYLDALLRSSYPAELEGIFGDAWPEVPAGDMALIAQPLDFVGINFYKRGVTRHDPAAWPVYASLAPQPQNPFTALGPDWEVYPPAFTDVLLWFRDRYGDMPVYVTENGAAFEDPAPAADGSVDDAERVGYLRRHLRALHAAIRAGVDVRGYYVWSLLDNFEWSAGYAPRFGIVGVDYRTFERTPKRSARFYAEVIATHGAAALSEAHSEDVRRDPG
ncbi:MAG TPA: GH1 family beta-glucosidase [Longimicrobiales bacterium]|nr:GH1 family beta-glucosidase [Longimicrobiales bacterium]